MAQTKRSSRLSLVVGLAKRKREEADRVLLDARQRLDSAISGLNQLNRFLNEYLQGAGQPVGRSLNVGALQTQAAFMARLRSSIEQQKGVVEHARANLEQVERWWRELYARESAVTKLQVKALETEQREAEKRLQSQIDELSQRRHPNFL